MLILPTVIIKDLGVNIVNDLSWHSDISIIVKKAHRICNTIIHSFHCHNVKFYMHVFDIYVRPIIEYNCFIWNLLLCKDIDVLENVQKCFTRHILKNVHFLCILYVEHLNVLNRVSFERCWLITSLTTLYNIFHKYIACDIMSDFHCLHNNLLGNSKRVFVPFCKSSVRKSFLHLDGSLFGIDCLIVY